MKQKLSVTIDEELVERLELKLNNNIFRNRSHLIEVALDEFLRKNK